MTGQYYDHRKKFVLFCGESENKDKDKTNRKKTNKANLSQCIIKSAEGQVGYILDDSDSDNDSIPSKLGYFIFTLVRSTGGHWAGAHLIKLLFN